MRTPQIDVVMPVYNAEAYVADAVKSILRQSFTNFRLICVDDGSTDHSFDILTELASNDQRMQIVRQQNTGVVRALNVGLSMCEAPLIARMDADDIAMPDRFSRQIEYLTANPNVVAVGTAILFMDTEAEPLQIEHFAPEHEGIINSMLCLKTGMAHASVMMRREAVQSVAGYRPEFEWVEDFDLWFRLAEKGRLANLSDVLYCYRQHTSSVVWNTEKQRRERLLTLIRDAYAQRGQSIPDSLVAKCRKRRSPGGPAKWARKAARQGNCRVAAKHIHQQWRVAPFSITTWRISLEVAIRILAWRLTRRPAKFPVIPHS